MIYKNIFINIQKNRKLKRYLIIGIILLGIAGFYTSCSKDSPDKGTLANLKSSLISEYYTNARYSAFAEKAKKEGYLQIAKLFKALATAEGVHARNFKKVLDFAGVSTETSNSHFVVGSTEKNLKDAIQEEIMDIDIIYPAYIRQSYNSAISEANITFSKVWEAEKIHKNLLVIMYDQLMTKVIKVKESSLASAPTKENLSKIEELFSKTNYYVCPVDGRLLNNNDVNRACAMCHISKSNFLAIN
jgi:rubrerythrin